MAKWTLYHTDGCHLCEQAYELVSPLIQKNDTLQLVDIMSSDVLIEAYQVKIPVLKSENNHTLFWPFTAHDVRQLLK